MKQKGILLFILIIYFKISIFGQLYQNAEIISLNNTRIKTLIKTLPKNKYDEHLFIEIYDSVHGSKKIYPKNIAGYCINGEEFKSFSIYDTIQKINWDLFAKVIEKGACELLYFNVFINEYTTFYAFKLNDEKFHHLFTNDMILDLAPSHYKYYIFHDEEVFKKYFALYFRKCDLIARKIEHQFYNISLLADMVKDYNECIISPSNHTH